MAIPFPTPEKPQRAGRGEYADPAALPRFQRMLHQRQMAAIRAARPARADDVDDTGRRWPGLVSHDAREALADLQDKQHPTDHRQENPMSTLNEDNAEQLLDLYAAAVTATVYNESTKVMSASTVAGAVSAVTATFSSTLHAGGAATFATTAAVTGNATVGGTLGVTGAFGANGATPVGASAAYTKTYNTAARVIPVAPAAVTAKTSSQNATATANTQTSSYVQADAQTIATLANALQTSYNAAQADIASLYTTLVATVADMLAVKKLVVALVVDLEAVGIAG